eukprot:jgi/Psemu1/304858/fgenesh1_kg.172_\
MCINQEMTAMAGRRRPREQSQRSSSSPPSPSPSPTMDVVENIDIADLDFKPPLHKELSKKCIGGSRSSRSSRSSSNSKRKGVKFNPAVAVREILHKNNYTEEETSQTWYQSDEYDTIRMSVLKDLYLLKTDLFQEGRNMTARGLEKYTPTGSLKESVRRRRQDAVWSVLDEQDLQVDDAEQHRLTYLVYDDKAIREAYKKHNRPSVDVARCAGRLDAQAVSYGIGNIDFSFSKVEPCDLKKKRTIKNIFLKSRRMRSADASSGATPLIPSAA